MSDLKSCVARAVADVVERELLGSVEVPAPPERVFRALASQEITQWWVRPGVFDTREWTGDVRVGGRWRASGFARGNPYALEGEFVAVDPPRQLVHTWIAVGEPVGPMKVTYHLEKIDAGTRITVRHSGFSCPLTCLMTAAGWETSFDRLSEILASENK
ncbi:MAG TPA: SRPBCC domain-containing protein [Terriglobales bacterium]|nr:SRPBCC domain-containing protein [Terriglobales bacterium]